ncbi:hypothetical protein CDL15_Pgr022441 [Punica granatum]|uniref:Uncharacterized protein n=1 Tax=Punica granatum TaxID=22663 RepID=A0A218XR72_PUNGR|nr:hypothetical protein CDL15_Pgr022441 [Punica granatum]
MVMDFEPFAEVTGRAWYNESVLDATFIDFLKEPCLMHISSLKVAIVDMIFDAIIGRKSSVLSARVSRSR